MAPLRRGEHPGRRPPVTLASPRDAIRADIGISLVPEDRKTEGLFLKLDGRSNVSLPVIDRFARGGPDRHARRDARRWRACSTRSRSTPRALYTPAGAFCGGNQQKIAIAKWLLAGSRILLMFDPTRGVDVGTKHELYLLMRAFADARRRDPVLLDRDRRAGESRATGCWSCTAAGSSTSSRATAISEEAIMRAALGEAGPLGRGRRMSTAALGAAAASPPALAAARSARSRGLLVAIAVFVCSCSRSSTRSRPAPSATSSSASCRRAAPRWRSPRWARRSSS